MPTRTAAPKPGLTAPKGEKELYKAIMANDSARTEAIAHEFPDYNVVAQFMVGADALATGDNEKAAQWLTNVATWEGEVASHPFTMKYIGGNTMAVPIAPGVSAALSVSKQSATLMLAEALQSLNRADEAISFVEGLLPTSVAAVSLAELYAEQGRWDDVIDLTNNLTNEDDATALLLTFRGRALREQGHFDAAREALKEALKSKKRSNEIRHLALRERAEAYAGQGRNAQARKDLERILAEDASAPGVRERINELA